VSTRAEQLWDALCRAYDALGFGDADGGDVVFGHLVLARILEPTSKLDCLRVLSEVGIDPASYATLKRRLPVYAQDTWRQRLAAACAKHATLGPASLVLFDVSTLYFETDQGDGFREPGYSKERRLEPQITIGLLTDASGFPLMVEKEVGQPGAGGQGSWPGWVQGLCRRRDYAEDRLVLPGGARVWGRFIGIITGSGARRSRGHRVGSRQRGRRAGGSGRARRV
jgi:hypothetical protein